MRLPAGRLVRSRVVTDPRTALVDALDRELTGYAVLEPQEALLLDGDERGIVTFRGGVPVVAYHTGSDRGGPAALADLATTGPYRLELFALPVGDLTDVHAMAELRVPPEMPAERLAGDQALAARTRDAVPDDRSRARSPTDAGSDEPSDRTGAVEAFLDDAEKIEAIREQARAEARSRAEQWGFDDLGPAGTDAERSLTGTNSGPSGSESEPADADQTETDATGR